MRIKYMKKELSYKPANFLDVYGKKGSTFGRRLWKFLCKPDNIIRLETASELGRPAVEGLVPLLEEKFKKQMQNDRVRQMTGHMIRQIMEQGCGFILTHQNNKVRTGTLFSRASKYRRPQTRGG